MAVASLCLSTFAVAEDVSSKPSVHVKCCGRIRHGLMAIGGETTGTKIRFERISWELKLNDAAHRAFAEKHNKEQVVVTGSLRKVKGIEVKDRWIVDVKTIAVWDPTKDKEETLLAIHGTLRSKAAGVAAGMTIEADGQSWPVDFATDLRLQPVAESLLNQHVSLVGQLKQFPEEESREPVLQVKTLKLPTDDCRE